MHEKARTQRAPTSESYGTVILMVAISMRPPPDLNMDMHRASVIIAVIIENPGGTNGWMDGTCRPQNSSVRQSPNPLFMLLFSSFVIERLRCAGLSSGAKAVVT